MMVTVVIFFVTHCTQPFHNKARTNKKKKEKVNRKQVNMVVTFTDDAERDRVGEQDAVDEDQEADLHWTK